MTLWHFSEDPTIERFLPRRSPGGAPDDEVVWAIDEWHAPMYLLPRDCPRACFWPGRETTAADRERWFGGTEARMVIAVEWAWLDRIRETVLYRYAMPEAPFTLIDPIAGHWVSRVAVSPMRLERVGDLLGALTGAGVEVRFMPSLVRLWAEVTGTTLMFSGTRLRNAHGVVPPVDQRQER